MWAILGKKKILPQALKSCPNSTKLPNLVTLFATKDKEDEEKKHYYCHCQAEEKTTTAAVAALLAASGEKFSYKLLA